MWGKQKLHKSITVVFVCLFVVFTPKTPDGCSRNPFSPICDVIEQCLVSCCNQYGQRPVYTYMLFYLKTAGDNTA